MFENLRGNRHWYLTKTEAIFLNNKWFENRQKEKINKSQEY